MFAMCLFSCFSKLKMLNTIWMLSQIIHLSAYRDEISITFYTWQHQYFISSDLPQCETPLWTPNSGSFVSFWWLQCDLKRNCGIHWESKQIIFFLVICVMSAILTVVSKWIFFPVTASPIPTGKDWWSKYGW